MTKNDCIEFDFRDHHVTVISDPPAHRPEYRPLLVGQVSTMSQREDLLSLRCDALTPLMESGLKLL